MNFNSQSIIVASANPTKINSVLLGFQRLFQSQEFTAEGIKVPSGVSDQPMSEKETYTGALNRAENAQKEAIEADFWVGIEGGLTYNVAGKMEAFAWIVVLSKEFPDLIGKARTASFEIAPPIAALIHEGYELGDADDMVFKSSNSKQKNGATGLLTGNVIHRTVLYEMAVILALIPFKNNKLYSKITQKISTPFIIQQYQSGTESYKRYTTDVGLWESEKYVFGQYLQKSDKILDLGCGTGRTTFPLYTMGYEDIIGLDLTPEMIEIAKELNGHFGVEIPFEVADARALKFGEELFDVVIFSFNGLMSIPNIAEREKALQEIARVLKSGGLFIFTTHDRENEPTYFDFWKEEEKKWAEGKQRRDLHEFGDLITFSKNETREIFIHIPNQAEIVSFVQKADFEVVETFYRADRFEESQKVKEKSGECRFWVVRKK